MIQVMLLRLTLLIQVMLLLWLTLLWGSCLWDAFCAMCMGGCGSAERAFAVRESLYANRQSLCKRAALTKAGDSYANR